MKLLSLLPALLLAACAATEPGLTSAGDLVASARAVIDEVDVEDVSEASRYIVVDVREPAEFAAGHIPGAVNVPRGLLEFRIGSIAADDGQADPSKEILVYCRSGARGALAAKTLEKMGYENVTNLAGGFLAWEAADRAIEKPE